MCALEACKKLESVNLKWCRHVSDVPLREALVKLPALRVLVLKGCEGVTDEGVLALANVKVKVKVMVKVKVQWEGCDENRSFFLMRLFCTRIPAATSASP